VIVARDFALVAGHRRIAIGLLAGTLNSAAAFSIAVPHLELDFASDASPMDGAFAFSSWSTTSRANA
jgi:hypothetical protein